MSDFAFVRNNIRDLNASIQYYSKINRAIKSSYYSLKRIQ